MCVSWPWRRVGPSLASFWGRSWAGKIFVDLGLKFGCNSIGWYNIVYCIVYNISPACEPVKEGQRMFERILATDSWKRFVSPFFSKFHWPDFFTCWKFCTISSSHFEDSQIDCAIKAEIEIQFSLVFKLGQIYFESFGSTKKIDVRYHYFTSQGWSKCFSNGNNKNGHILPTGQWYAPSAVINDALIMPEYARICQSMPEYARVCQSIPEYARVC